MTFPLEYPIAVTPKAKHPVQRPVRDLLALFGILLLLVSFSPAQHESTSSSSSSGHAVSATAPAASSFSHAGTFSGGTSFSHTSHSPGSSGHNNNHLLPTHHHGATGEIYYPYVYGIPAPYEVDATDPNTSIQADQEPDDAEYQGGPTVFDRRGSGKDSYVPPTYDGPAHARAAQDAVPEPVESESQPEPQQPLTALVFKDGRLLEIENYAIVSQTLYDLTPGHPRKIALADLDLPATEKQNDDRGVTFQLPPGAQTN